jgi:hypothetical protein
MVVEILTLWIHLNRSTQIHRIEIHENRQHLFDHSKIFNFSVFLLDNQGLNDLSTVADRRVRKGMHPFGYILAKVIPNDTSKIPSNISAISNSASNVVSLATLVNWMYYLYSYLFTSNH